MNTPAPLRWSIDVDQAEWMKARLSGLLEGTVSSIVPTGFDAYAQILHPVETPVHGDALIRWIDVATWGGQELTARSRWLAVAMPEYAPPQPRPWKSQGPTKGTLHLDDARALMELAREFTDTPRQCWCCIWDGFGWGARLQYGPRVDVGSSPAPGPIPIEVQTSPKVHTPYRDYFLYETSLDASFTDAIRTLEGHSPNVWWPADRAWCVGTEVDCDSTYVGGSRAFIDAILDAGGLEAFEVLATDGLFLDLPDWMLRLVDRTVDELLASGSAAVATSIGGVRYGFKRPRLGRRGFVRYESEQGGQRGGSGQSPLRNGSSEGLRRELEFRVHEGLRNLAS
jgi:hypothetical protein